MESPECFAVKGTFLDTPEPGALRCRDGYMTVKAGIVSAFSEKLPEGFAGALYDYTGLLICPGFSDLHLHASQYQYCGTAMDVTLLDWLQNYAYPEEARYADVDYAGSAYSVFVRDLLRSGTTRSCIFATIHTEATLELQRQLEEAGLISLVGKLSIDRSSPDYYREPSAEAGAAETERWLRESRSRGFTRALPMITPRFTPSVTDDYMRRLGELAVKYSVPMQSHLSENPEEIAWVSELCPDTRFYGETYSRYGLFGGEVPTVMAHCIYSGEEEIALMKENGVFIAHCPTSNENVIAGISPAAAYLRSGQRIGLGSDVSGGHTLNLFAVMAAAVQVSKLRWKFISDAEKPLTLPEAFYMATAGGGSFFGKVGLFEPGYEFDAAVFDDDMASRLLPLSPAERLERYAYRGDGRATAKFVRGVKVV